MMKLFSKVAAVVFVSILPIANAYGQYSDVSFYIECPDEIVSETSAKRTLKFDPAFWEDYDPSEVRVCSRPALRGTKIEIVESGVEPVRVSRSPFSVASSPLAYVSIQLKSSAFEDFFEVTSGISGRRIVVAFKGRIIMAPVMMGEGIDNGQLLISGMSEEKVNAIMALLNDA